MKSNKIHSLYFKQSNKKTYNTIGDYMYNKGPCCPPPNRGGGFLSILAIFALCILIFYQVILTLILPLRFNIFILLLEIFILIFLLYRIIWPH
jgi:hypothetical protein